MSIEAMRLEELTLEERLDNKISRLDVELCLDPRYEETCSIVKDIISVCDEEGVSLDVMRKLGVPQVLLEAHEATRSNDHYPKHLGEFIFSYLIDLMPKYENYVRKNAELPVEKQDSFARLWNEWQNTCSTVLHERLQKLVSSLNEELNKEYAKLNQISSKVDEIIDMILFTKKKNLPPHVIMQAGVPGALIRVWHVAQKESFDDIGERIYHDLCNLMAVYKDGVQTKEMLVVEEISQVTSIWQEWEAIVGIHNEVVNFCSDPFNGSMDTTESVESTVPYYDLTLMEDDNEDNDDAAAISRPCSMIVKRGCQGKPVTKKIGAPHGQPVPYYDLTTEDDNEDNDDAAAFSRPYSMIVTRGSERPNSVTRKIATPHSQPKQNAPHNQRESQRKQSPLRRRPKRPKQNPNPKNAPHDQGESQRKQSPLRRRPKQSSRMPQFKGPSQTTKTKFQDAQKK